MFHTPFNFSEEDEKLVDEFDSDDCCHYETNKMKLPTTIPSHYPKVNDDVSSKKYVPYPKLPSMKETSFNGESNSSFNGESNSSFNGESNSSFNGECNSSFNGNSNSSFHEENTLLNRDNILLNRDNTLLNGEKSYFLLDRPLKQEESSMDKKVDVYLPKDEITTSKYPSLSIIDYSKDSSIPDTSSTTSSTFYNLESNRSCYPQLNNPKDELKNNLSEKEEEKYDSAVNNIHNIQNVVGPTSSPEILSTEDIMRQNAIVEAHMRKEYAKTAMDLVSLEAKLNHLNAALRGDTEYQRDRRKMRAEMHAEREIERQNHKLERERKRREYRLQRAEESSQRRLQISESLLSQDKLGEDHRKDDDDDDDDDDAS